MAIHLANRQLFIDGEWREAVLKKRIPVINPATEEIIGDIPAATAEDVEIAVEAAKKAFSRNKGKDWSSASGAYRAKYLRAIAAKITERKSELGKLEAIDSGKPLDEALWDMDDVAGCFEYYADLAEGLDAKQKAPVSLPMETFKSYVLKEPLGVVALITPWNYPLLLATWKVAPALAAGCTAILKPSELASVTCLELADVCKKVGLPPGVLNILTGLGTEAGAPLASHPHVDKVAFTGSNATGSRIMAPADEWSSTQQQELQALLDSFSAIFGAPKTLPPVRDFDHRIPLVAGYKPPSIRPYAYGPLQKSEIEKCVSSCSSWEDFVKIFCRDFGSHGFEDYYERYSRLDSLISLLRWKLILIPDLTPDESSCVLLWL